MKTEDSAVPEPTINKPGDPLWCTPVDLVRRAALTVKGGQKGLYGSSEKPG